MHSVDCDSRIFESPIFHLKYIVYYIILNISVLAGPTCKIYVFHFFAPSVLSKAKFDTPVVRFYFCFIET